MSETRARIGWFPALLAVVMPLAVFAGAFTYLQRPAEVSGIAAEMEGKLALTRPRVLVIGSSVAKRDVQMERLGRRLSMSPRQMLMLTLPNSTGAHWYSVLKNRVYGNGHRPDVVVVVSALGTMVTAEVLGDSNMDRLVNQLGPDEPVVARKVFGLDGQDGFRWRYVREQAGNARSDMLASVRDASVGLFWGSRRWDPETGNQLAISATESVFSADRMDYSLHRGGDATGLGMDVEDEEYTRVVDPSDSFIPDLVELAKENGSTIVFVRTPFPPSNPDKDRVPVDVERKASELFSELGVGYLDMRSLGLDDSYFEDMVHMNTDGARIMTDALADALIQWDALGDDARPAVAMGSATRNLERTGTLPTLPALSGARAGSAPCTFSLPLGRWAGLSDAALSAVGYRDTTPLQVLEDGKPLAVVKSLSGGCSGEVVFGSDAVTVAPKGGDLEGLELRLDDALPAMQGGVEHHWVYPGTSLRFRFDAPWDPEDPTFAVFAIGTGFAAKGGEAVLEVDGQSFPFESYRSRWWRTAELPPPAGEGWEVVLTSPEDGPALLVQNLVVGRAPRTAHLVGQAETLYGASVRLVGGRSGQVNIEPEYLDEPPELAQGSMKEGPRGLSLLTVPELAWIADADDPSDPYPNDCSPVRIAEDGVPLPLPHAQCAEVAVQKGGRYCHVGKQLYVSGSDDSLPSANGRSYELFLDPSRLCPRFRQLNTTPLRDVLWLYPGDRIRYRVPAEKLDGFFDGANKLELMGMSFVPDGEESSLDVTLRVGGEPVLEDSVMLRELWRGKSWVLEPALQPRITDVEVEIHNTSESSYLLFTQGSLSEDYQYGYFEDPRKVRARARQAAKAAEAGEEGLALDDEPDEGPGEEAVTDAPEEEVATLVEPSDAPHPTVVEGLFAAASETRSGSIPELPPLKRVTELSRDMVEGHLFALWSISNATLEKEGRGPWSPLQVLQNGAPLRMVQSRRAFRSDCVGCFIHIGQSVVWRVAGPGEITVRLDPSLPGSAPDGTSPRWIYPGTRATYTFDAMPAGEEPIVIVEGLVYAMPGANQGPPTLVVDGQAHAFEAGMERMRAWAPLVRVGKGTAFELVVPDKGQFLLVTGVYVGTADEVQAVFPPLEVVPPAIVDDASEAPEEEPSR